MKNEINEVNLEKKKKWYKKWWGILLIFGIIIISLILIIYILLVIKYYYQIKNGEPLLSQNLPQKTKEEIIQKIHGKDYNNIMGEKNAPITIVEFGDFACPMCKASFPKVRELSAKYPAQVRIIFRNYPAISAESATLAHAALCAGEQDKFWSMHDKLFLNSGIATDEDLTALFEQTGGDTAQFQTCMKEQKYLEAVQNDMKDGQDLGVAGTPTFFVNNYKVSGDVPREVWEKMIEEILNQK